MILEEVQTYLNSFINYEHHLEQVSVSLLKLDRIKALLGLIGNPQDNLKIIHVAGSKGKGSTCALTASILKEAGYKVGLYTSPHLYYLNERIRILRRGGVTPPLRDALFFDSISNERIKDVLKKIKPYLEKMRSTKKFGNLTFFEVLTALALFYFLEEEVDWVILETGLGGRLDATNAVCALVSVITPISLEHTYILGDTLEKIAVEKAAIIKDQHAKVVLAPQEQEVEEVIQKRCEEFGIKPLWIEKDIKYELNSQDLNKQTFRLQGRSIYKNLELPLLGYHQVINATVAVGIIESLKDLGFDIPKESIYEGLRNVYWPGRFEIVADHPYVLLDGAHNEASIRSLVETFKKIFLAKKVTLILGFSKDKNEEAICGPLQGIVHTVIATKTQHPRAANLNLADIQRLFPQQVCLAAENVPKALKLAYAKTHKEDIILVTGSLFVVAEVRKILI